MPSLTRPTAARTPYHRTASQVSWTCSRAGTTGDVAASFQADGRARTEGPAASPPWRRSLHHEALAALHLVRLHLERAAQRARVQLQAVVRQLRRLALRVEGHDHVLPAAHLTGEDGRLLRVELPAREHERPGQPCQHRVRDALGG